MPALVQTILPDFLEIAGADTIEIIIDDVGHMWINVDGLCQVRAHKTEAFVIDDRRKTKKEDVS